MDGHVWRKRPLDLIASSRRFSVRPAETAEVHRLIETAANDIPVMKVIVPSIMKVHSFNPETVLAVIGRKGLVGGFGVLYLNAFGFEALLTGALSIADPDLRYLAAQGEAPKALYGWAMHLPGPAMAAMGNTMAEITRPRQSNAEPLK